MAFVYGAVQVLGAVAGVATTHLMFDLPAFTLSTLPRDLPSLWLSETIATAGLIFVILGGIAARGPVPALVGAYITAAFWFTASTGFANPAMTIARTLTGSGAGLVGTGAGDLHVRAVAQRFTDQAVELRVAEAFPPITFRPGCGREGHAAE